MQNVNSCVQLAMGSRGSWLLHLKQFVPGVSLKRFSCVAPLVVSYFQGRSVVFVSGLLVYAKASQELGKSSSFLSGLMWL